MTLTAGLAQVAGDQFATTGWSATSDPYSMYVAGASAVNSYIQILQTGRYDLEFIANWALAASGAAGVCYITYNAANVQNSICRTGGSALQGGGDNTWAQAVRLGVSLNAGDKLYWGTWASAATTLNNSKFGLPTEVTVRMSK